MPSPSAAITRATHNLLVVSDLHLGEALIDTTASTTGHLQRIDRAFHHFLDYYARHRVDGRQWRLIVAGDMIDFVRARMAAEPAPGDGRAWACGALDRIVAVHTDPFVHLARFVAAGNEVVILRGNHDADLHWDEVQAQLVEHLATFAPADPDGVRQRVTFSRWFWHESDLVYVEHGNQYDRFCSFENVLEPTVGTSSDLEDPIAHQTFRAFARLVLGTMDVHAVDHWTLPDFARWLSGLGPRLISRLLFTYVTSVAWMVRTQRKLQHAARRTRTGHLARMRDLAQRFQLREDVVHAIDALRDRPAGLRVRHGLRMLYMDHAIVLGLGALIALGLLVLPLPAGARTFGLFATLLVVVSAVLALARARDVSPAPKLRRAAARIGELVSVRFVVFGHSHVPEIEPLAGGATYFNTGSWTGDSGGGLTHLCILRDTPRAELRRWCVDSGAPVAAAVRT